MPRSAGQTRFRLPSSFHQHVRPLSQAARLPCAEPRPGRVAHEKSLLHPGDDLAGYFQIGAHPVDAVRMQANHGFGNHDRGVELIRDRHPVMPAESSLGEPTADLAPKARVMRPLALDAPAQARATGAPRAVIDAADAEV